MTGGSSERLRARCEPACFSAACNCPHALPLPPAMGLKLKQCIRTWRSAAAVPDHYDLHWASSQKGGLLLAFVLFASCFTLHWAVVWHVQQDGLLHPAL